MVPIHQTLFRQSTASVLDVRKDASEIVSMKREEWKDETILMLTLRGNGILTHKGRRRMLSAGRAFIGIGMEDSTHGPDPDFPMAWETACNRLVGQTSKYHRPGPSPPPRIARRSPIHEACGTHGAAKVSG
jgi:hypothetical protein